MLFKKHVYPAPARHQSTFFSLRYGYVMNLGTLTSWNPLGHSRPVTGLLFTVM